MTSTPDHSVRSGEPDVTARVTSADRGMIRAAGAAVVLSAVLGLVVVAVAAATADGPAVTGAVIGTALGLVVTIPTFVTTLLAPRVSPLLAAAIMLGGWLAKMALVVIALLVIRNSPSVSVTWLAAALLIGALAGVALETVLFSRLRQPVQTSSDQADEGLSSPRSRP